MPTRGWQRMASTLTLIQYTVYSIAIHVVTDNDIDIDIGIDIDVDIDVDIDIDVDT